MLFSTSLISLGLMASAVVAAPHKLKARAGPGGDVVVYWGQNFAAATENADLSTYCTADSGISILVLSFLSEYGVTGEYPSGTIGPTCTLSTDGSFSGCSDLASQIKTCQSNGVKIVLSLGGENGAYSLQSQQQAETIGENLWNYFGSSGNSSRPFGSNVVDGFDFDLESNSGNQYYQYMISTLRSKFATDSAHQYIITGAPQCPLPEVNMGEIISNAQFDYLWVQFYNNPYCSYPNTLNFDAWATYLAGTPSKNAKLVIGVPASTLASTGTSSGAAYYMTPPQLVTAISSFTSNSLFGGIMMWSAGFSDSNVIDSCTFAQQASSILKNGAPCGGGSGTLPSKGPTPSSSATATSSASVTPTSSSPATSSSSAASGAPVAQWGQCGGTGYTGSTVCASGLKCVAEGSYWSSCQ